MRYREVGRPAERLPATTQRGIDMRIRTLLCLVTMLILTALSAQAYRLQFKDTAGATRNYAMTVNTKGTMSVMGMSMPLTSVTTMTAVEKVLNVKNGSASVSYEIKDGKIKVTIAGIPGEDEPQTVDQPMPGFTMTYDRTPLGKVSNVKMTGEITNMLGGFDPSSSQYPGQGLEFPDKDLKAGDTWTGQQSLEVAPGSTVDMKAKYTLTGTKVVEGKTYLVLTCDITASAPKITITQPENKDQPAEAQPAITGLTLKGKATTLFDEAAGEIFSETFTMDVSMNLAGGIGEAGAVKMTMDGTLTRKK